MASSASIDPTRSQQAPDQHPTRSRPAFDLHLTGWRGSRRRLQPQRRRDRGAAGLAGLARVASSASGDWITASLAGLAPVASPVRAAAGSSARRHGGSAPARVADMWAWADTNQTQWTTGARESVCFCPFETHFSPRFTPSLRQDRQEMDTRWTACPFGYPVERNGRNAVAP